MLVAVTVAVAGLEPDDVSAWAPYLIAVASIWAVVLGVLWRHRCEVQALDEEDRQLYERRKEAAQNLEEEQRAYSQNMRAKKQKLKQAQDPGPGHKLGSIRLTDIDVRVNGRVIELTPKVCATRDPGGRFQAGKDASSGEASTSFDFKVWDAAGRAECVQLPADKYEEAARMEKQINNAAAASEHARSERDTRIGIARQALEDARQSSQGVRDAKDVLSSLDPDPVTAMRRRRKAARQAARAGK